MKEDRRKYNRPPRQVMETYLDEKEIAQKDFIKKFGKPKLREVMRDG